MTECLSIFETARSDYEFDVATTLKSAKEKLGRSYFSVTKEIYQFSRAIGKLSPQEYIFYRLYDNEALSADQNASFLGRQTMEELDKVFLKNAWTHVAADKLVMGSFLGGLGLPVAETVALYHPYRTLGAKPCLTNQDTFAAYLREEASYPLLGKPAAGVNSLGVAVIEAYDRTSDYLLFSNGESHSLLQFIAEVEQYFRQGYCLQKPLVPHRDLVALCGPRISSIRVFLIVGEDGPELLRASWKISTGTNVADNFWRRGNLLAALDVDSGEVLRVIRGAGPDQELLETHPDTGAKLLGVCLPGWEVLRATVLEASAALPNCRVQGWDVVLTDNGPVLLELEGDGGHPQMVQLPQARGLYEGCFKDFYDARRQEAQSGAGEKCKKKKSIAA